MKNKIPWEIIKGISSNSFLRKINSSERMKLQSQLKDRRYFDQMLSILSEINYLVTLEKKLLTKKFKNKLKSST